MNPKELGDRDSLFKWIWHSYLKTALIPLVLVEMVFIGIYFVTNSWSQKEIVSFLREEVQTELQQIADQESIAINHQIRNITNLTEMYASQTNKALNTTTAASSDDLNRMVLSKEKAFYTRQDSKEGGVAVYFSGIVPVNEAERAKVSRVLTLQPLMKDITISQPLVASIYLNTFDSLNIIYPYFDVISQYPPLMDIPKYNFYYEADALHNPERKVKWTEVYLDPAGHGWMASCIKPVYNGDFLEGVVGIDITVSTITNQILNDHIPWQGYCILLSQDGSILALPEKGENDWGLKELTSHSYNEAIMNDTFKPDQFNLYKRSDLLDLAREVSANSNGFYDFMLKNQRQVTAWASVPETGWKLLVIVPEANIYSKVNEMSRKLFIIGTYMIIGLIAFYCIFIIILARRARTMSLNISQPLVEINGMVKRIGVGDYFQKQPNFDVKELQETATLLVGMGEQLGRANQDLLISKEALKKGESELQALVNSIDDAVYAIDEQGIILKVWAKDSSLFTLPINELCGAFLESVFSTDAANKHRTAINRVMETNEPETIEYILNTPRGERWIQARFARISSDSGVISVSARDISERKDMEKSIIAAKEEAEKASKAKSEFLSSMSHELRTPLNAVLGFAQLLEIDPAAPLNESQKESVDKIIKGGNYLLVLINEVLDLAKIESGKMSVSIEPVLVKSVVEETLELMRPLADKYDVEIISQSHFECIVNVDRTRLKQVLINLISNAIKYNKEHGRVLFYYELNDGLISFNIIDQGAGIPSSKLESIFEPFYRLPSTERFIEGTGIGLTVARQLVELMGGYIRVESREGIGSHFRVILPNAEVSTETGNKPTIVLDKIDKAAITHQFKILYVEDNPDNLSFIENIIKMFPGVIMLSAATGEMGIDLALAQKPDLILIDINLPGMNGFKMLRMLQEYEEARHIPVIAISASAMDKDIQMGLEAGFEDYVTKPVNISKIIKVFRTCRYIIRKWLRRL